MKKHKYQIRYQHASWNGAESKQSAVESVRAMAGQRKIFTVDVTDGTYCYRTDADRKADQTGARAFAVICGPEQQDD